MTDTGDELLPGLWQFCAEHPDWTEDEGGEEGWEPLVSWWATSTSRGLLLIDPLVADWEPLDELVATHRGCAGIVRTIHWHQRSITAAAVRYDAQVWAMPAAGSPDAPPPDHVLEDRTELWDGIQAFGVERDDEIALWLPEHAALLFADAMLRRGAGRLWVCPDSWTQPSGGPERLRARLGELGRLPVRHVLVSHGPSQLDGGREAMTAALG